jgi:hypothetical protein
MKSTKGPTKGRTGSTKKSDGPCRARTCDRRIMRKVSRRVQSTTGLSATAQRRPRQAPKAHPKRENQPTIRPTNLRRKRLIHDITARSLRR